MNSTIYYGIMTRYIQDDSFIPHTQSIYKQICVHKSIKPIQILTKNYYLTKYYMEKCVLKIYIQ